MTIKPADNRIGFSDRHSENRSPASHSQGGVDAGAFIASNNRFNRALGLWILGVGAVIAGGLVWHLSEASSGAQQTDTLVQPQDYIIAVQSVRSEVGIAATIEEGQRRSILAPFDGNIRELNTQFGSRVDAGDLLVTIDTSQIRSEERTAQTIYMKALMQAQELDNWNSGPEMQRARRFLEAELSRTEKLNGELNEAKRLLASGIISRNEVQGVEQQLEAQNAAVTSARDELASTEARASDQYRQLAHLDLDNASERLASIQLQMKGAKIVAPSSGVVIQPQKITTGVQISLMEVGAPVKANVAMFSIADTSNLVASGYVDEGDVSALHVGQTAVIVIDAASELTFEGRIIAINAEASTEGGIGQRPTYAVKVLFTASQEFAKGKIRLGMSARLTAVTGSVTEQLVVPPTAIKTDESGSYIEVRNSTLETFHRINIEVGPSTPEGIAINGDVSEGDRVKLLP